MSELFDISSSTGVYKVNVSEGCVTNSKLFSEVQNACFIVDENVRQLWGCLFDDLPLPIYVLKANEENKTLLKVGEIIEWMRSIGVTKNNHVYAVGGGIVQDLSTFICSTYMRGINWTYIPTTLLGMVDSCIGGKSSINVGSFKNIAGNFYPPDSIYVDVHFCRTLQKNEIIAGLSEAVKIIYADQDADFEEYLSFQMKVSDELPFKTMSRMVALTLKTKKRFIEQDEFDRGIRQLLNFGHGIGHAIEASSCYAINHGVAVGVGMIAEVELSKYLSPADYVSDRAVKLVQYLKDILLEVDGLGEELKKISVDVALDKFKSDKKHAGDKYAFITIDEHGYLKKIMIEKNAATDIVLKNSFLKLHNFL